jgi:hypothetical protein
MQGHVTGKRSSMSSLRNGRTVPSHIFELRETTEYLDCRNSAFGEEGSDQVIILRKPGNTVIHRIVT